MHNLDKKHYDILIALRHNGPMPFRQLIHTHVINQTPGRRRLNELEEWKLVRTDNKGARLGIQQLIHLEEQGRNLATIEEARRTGKLVVDLDPEEFRRVNWVFEEGRKTLGPPSRVVIPLVYWYQGRPRRTTLVSGKSEEQVAGEWLIKAWRRKHGVDLNYEQPLHLNTRSVNRTRKYVVPRSQAGPVLTAIAKEQAAPPSMPDWF